MGESLMITTTMMMVMMTMMMHGDDEDDDDGLELYGCPTPVWVPLIRLLKHALIEQDVFNSSASLIVRMPPVRVIRALLFPDIIKKVKRQTSSRGHSHVQVVIRAYIVRSADTKRTARSTYIYNRLGSIIGAQKLSPFRGSGNRRYQ